jgi:hypothetical protein
MATDLVTLAEYKSYIGITSATQDNAIKSIIPKASALVKSTCRRTFVDYVNDAKTDVFASGSARVYLKEFPVLAISSVEYSSDYGATYTALVEFTDYVVNLEDGYIDFLNWEIIPQQLNAYRVVYTAGYETLPEDIKVACLDLITYYLKSDMSVKSQRDAGSNTVQIEYITKNTLPSHIQRVLELYLADVS